jgi:sensor histidine kinase YesM
VSGGLPYFKDHSLNIFVASVLTTVTGFVVFHADALFDRFLSWRKSFMLRWLLGFTINTVVAIALVLVGNLYFQSEKDAVIKISVLFTMTIFLYEIFYGWFYSYRYYAHAQVEELQAERWQLELQFQSLKSQISPHYLFNCLNTISSLLYKDSHTAEKFIRRMADTFRYVLTNQKQQLVTLQQELDFVKAYYFLLQVRYEQHLQLEINVPKSILTSVIPPLTLQLLVENAVKHNEISKELPLLVYISARDNTHLLVTNNRTSKMEAPGFKVGVENIRQRYQFFTEEKVLVQPGATFTVQLPILKNKVVNK